MGIFSDIYRSSVVNFLRGNYHRFRGLFLDGSSGLLIPPQNSFRLLRLIEKLRPIATEHQLIRVGPDADGGYLVPDDLFGISASYSPGVSDAIGFDLDCAQRGMKVFMADASVNGLPSENPSLAFTKKFLGCWDDQDHTTLDSWVNATKAEAGTGDLLLQMDIEGSEYQVLSSVTDEVLSRFRIIVIEFHMLDNLWNRGFLALVEPIFNRLLRSHYCVHLHPNNCCGSIVRCGIEIPRIMEFTFILKDRVASPHNLQHNFPHPLDVENTTKSPLVLPECWWNPAFRIN